MTPVDSTTQISIQTKYETFAQILREITHLESIAAFLSWDQLVMMPSGAATARAQQMAALSGLLHERRTSPVLGELIKDLMSFTQPLPASVSAPHKTNLTQLNIPGLNEYQCANVRDGKRSYDMETKLPASLVKQIAELESAGYETWVTARKQSNFALFAPVLQKWLDLTRQKAAFIDPSKDPYDVCLDTFERGVTTKRITELFEVLKTELIPIIRAVCQKTGKTGNEPSAFDELFHGSAASGSQKSGGKTTQTSVTFPISVQQKFSERVAKDLGFSLTHGRLDVSVHPFTGGAGPYDVRMTTRYTTDRSFVEGLMGTVHETGHSLYEQQRNAGADADALPVSQALSMGIHESQSLFWERMVGLSLPFWEYYTPILRSQEYFQYSFPPHVEVNSLWRAINEVRPSLIRVESDEVTYPMHIILRFEIERDLLSGKLAVMDVPKVWNAKMKEYLGIVPKNDTEGCLQDTHWSSGSLGYFPTYTLGAIYACQFFQKAEEEIPDLTQAMSRGDFTLLKSWLRSRIHERGSLIPSGDALCEMVTGEPLNPMKFIKYIRKKVTTLYGV